MGTTDLADHAVSNGVNADDMQQYSLSDAGVEKHPSQGVVELTANAGSSGKMKKSGSGFLKGLLRNKSSGNLTDASLEHREASGPPSEAGSAYAAESVADSGSGSGKKKGVKKLLSLGRSKKKGSSASLSEHNELDTGADVDT